MSALNESYKKKVLGAGERMWDRNKDKMEAKGITKESYMLGYLHGYESCFETYDIDQLGPIIKEYSKKEEKH